MTAATFTSTAEVPRFPDRIAAAQRTGVPVDFRSYECRKPLKQLCPLWDHKAGKPRWLGLRETWVNSKHRTTEDAGQLSETTL
jgi:hypothetical protein